LTVGIMHIPQGMAYSLLASLPPIYGLYTSFFPVLIYWIFGTSKHISVGTFAVVSLMVANAITKVQDTYAPPVGFNFTANDIRRANNLSFIDTSKFLSNDNERARVLISMSQCFWVGVINLVMYVFQFGFITSYLSEPLINSFTAGAAIHVFTSQMKFIFGVKVTGYVGVFKIIRTYIDLFSKLGTASVATIIISAISIFILLTIKIQINERFAKRMMVPFPTELLIVVFGTIISYYAKLQPMYNIKVIGKLKPGLPAPEVPPLFLINDLLVDCIVTAIIAFTINYSLSDIYAKKHKYKINPTQELLALGASNIFSSFFSCFTGGASLARSSVQDGAGGKTQLVSVVSSVLLCVVLLEVSPVFEPLPEACLASIVIVALKNLILQVFQLKFYWKTNKIEFFQFLITLLGVVVLDVDIGLGIGVGFNVLISLVRQTKPNSAVLGNIPGTEIYKDTKMYKKAQEFDGIKIVRIEESLHSTNASFFKKQIYNFTSTKPQEYINRRMKLERQKKRLEDKNKPLITRVVPGAIQRCFPKFFSKYQQSDDRIHKNDLKEVKSVSKSIDAAWPASPHQFVNPGLQEDDLPEYEHYEKQADGGQVAETESQLGDYDYQNEIKSIEKFDENNFEEDEISSDEEDYAVLPRAPYHHIIIDCSPLNYIDTVGVKTLNQIIMDYKQINVKVFLAECNDAILDRFEEMHEALPRGSVRYVPPHLIYLTVHDAALSAKKEFEKKNNSLKAIL